MCSTDSDTELNKCTIDTPLFGFKDEVHKAKVVKCYDGDTIYCCFKHNGCYSKFKVRMYGFDSPEMKPSRQIPNRIRNKIKKRAKAAKKRLEELILDKIVYLHCIDFGKYGRILGVVKLNSDDEKSINDIMIEEGHGYVYKGGTKRLPSGISLSDENEEINKDEENKS